MRRLVRTLVVLALVAGGLAVADTVARIRTEDRIADPETGRELSPGAVGELWVRGPQVMAGYCNEPDATARTLVEGWLRTVLAQTVIVSIGPCPLPKSMRRVFHAVGTAINFPSRRTMPPVNIPSSAVSVVPREVRPSPRKAKVKCRAAGNRALSSAARQS